MPNKYAVELWNEDVQRFERLATLDDAAAAGAVLAAKLTPDNYVRLRTIPGLETLPARVVAAVSRNLAILRAAADDLESGRCADRKFGGGGRYEAETWAFRLAEAVERAELGLRTFEELAEKNGVLPADVYEQLGGRATVALSPAGAAYYADLMAV